MAAFNNGPWLGARLVRPTEAQLQTIEDFEAGLGDAGVQRLWRHLQYFTQHLSIATTINNNTVVSLIAASRIPYKIVGIDIGCETAAASADGNIEKEPAAGGGYTTMQEAVVDMQTGAGSYVAAVVTDGTEDVAFGDKVRLTVTAGVGAVVGSQALLHCFRL
jgi:hypothetical protein